MKNWQHCATDFAQKHSLLRTPEIHALDLVSETGEVMKELLLASNYGQQQAEFTENLAFELGDVLYSLCVLASSTGIDLEAAFSKTIEKYEKRWLTKGHISSANTAVFQQPSP